jgi:hypothetical protein
MNVKTSMLDIRNSLFDINFPHTFVNLIALRHPCPSAPGGPPLSTWAGWRSGAAVKLRMAGTCPRYINPVAAATARFDKFTVTGNYHPDTTLSTYQQNDL